MSRASKRKGYEAERELAKLLAEWGITEAIRHPMSGALVDWPGDVRIDGYCAEAKRQEKTSIWAWWAQTCAAARGGRHPILFFRRSRSPWLVTLEAQTWAAMETELRQLREVASVAA